MQNSILLFSLLLPITLSLESDSTCSWTDPDSGNKFDFSSLERPDGWRVKDLQTERSDSLFNINFIFNFCASVTSNCNFQDDVAVYEALEVIGQLTDVCEVLGSTSRTEYSSGTTMGAKGVKITYKGGEVCTGSENAAQNGLQMQASFNVICSEKADEQFKQLPFNGITITKCSPEFFIRHPVGCGSLGHSSTSYFKWLSLLVIVYIVGGSLYNVKMHNKTGLEAFPNINFWRNLRKNLTNFPSVIIKLRQKAALMKGGPSGEFMQPQGLTTTSSRSIKYTVV